MRQIRSKLRAIKRKRSDGVIYWAARGVAPIREEDGSLTFRRFQHRLDSDTAAGRQAEVDALNRAYEDAATRAERPITFALALKNYLDAKHSVPLYAEKLVLYLGARLCADINDTVMNEVRSKMFAPDAAASYINRHLYTPVIAILAMALKEKAPHLTRPKGHKMRADDTHIEIPPDDWYDRLEPHLPPNCLAIMYFLTLHGRRLGDALGRKPSDFDPERRTLTIGRTKNGDPLSVPLHARVAELIEAMPGWRTRRWLFGDGPNAASNVRKDFQAACAKAGLEYYAPHEFGRHAFATRMLRAGYSLQFVRDAGGWKTIEVLSRIYGHLEQKEWVAGVHKVGDALFAVRGTKTEALTIDVTPHGDTKPSSLLGKPVAHDTSEQ